MQSLLRAAATAALIASSALCQITIPPHSAIYNGFSRGYNFTAATNFTIARLQLPPEAMQAGDTGSFLVRINGVTTLRTVGVAGDSIFPNISVNNGDVVDIIGNWSPAVTGNFTAHNSYTATGPATTTIGGVPHTLTRTGWQWDIGDTAWASGTYLAPVAGQMGRINLYESVLPGIATVTPYGTGCVNSPGATFYELFQAGTFDLSNTSIQLTPSGGGTGYVVIPGSNTWLTPTGPSLGLTDDSVSTGQPLGFTLNYPGGSTNTVYVSSNGYIWAQNNTNNGCCAGDPIGLRNSGARWCPQWGDLNPGAGGQVQFDTAPGMAAVTWTAVPEFGATNANTFQVVFFNTGVVEMRWQACSVVSHVVLTGFSPGANNPDPGSVDISASLPIVTTPHLTALRLNASPRPSSATSSC